jgi:hypothetical protein
MRMIVESCVVAGTPFGRGDASAELVLAECFERVVDGREAEAGEGGLGDAVELFRGWMRLGGLERLVEIDALPGAA